MKKFIGTAESFKFVGNRDFPATEFMGRWGVDEICLDGGEF